MASKWLADGLALPGGSWCRPAPREGHLLRRAAGVHGAQQASPLATERLSILCVQPSGTLGPFPAVIGRYEPFMGNTFMGSRVFPSGASIDSLSTYQAMVY